MKNEELGMKNEKLKMMNEKVKSQSAPATRNYKHQTTN
jgi:hypothetical protein